MPKLIVGGELGAEGAGSVIGTDWLGLDTMARAHGPWPAEELEVDIPYCWLAMIVGSMTKWVANGMNSVVLGQKWLHHEQLPRCDLQADNGGDHDMIYVEKL